MASYKAIMALVFGGRDAATNKSWAWWGVHAVTFRW